MHTLQRIVARVEEPLCVETALVRSPRGILEEPHTTDDLASLMQGLLGPPLAHAYFPDPVPTSPMILDMLDTSHALLYNHTIGFVEGGNSGQVENLGDMVGLASRVHILYTD